MKKRNSKELTNSKKILSDINSNNQKFWERISKQFDGLVKSHPHAMEHAAKIMEKGILHGSLESLTFEQIEFLAKDKAINGKKGGYAERREKSLIKAEWDSWQKDPQNEYHGRATEFSNAMLKKYSPDPNIKSEIGQRTINRWCTEWKNAKKIK